MHTLIHILVLEDETEDYFMHLWAQDIHTELLCASAWPTGKLHEVMVEAESNLSQCSKCWLYLNNLFIWHPGHEKILFVLVWIELDTVWYLPVGEAGDTLACREEGGGIFKSKLQNNTQWLFTKVHLSCLNLRKDFQCCKLCPCRQQQP